MDEWKKRHRAAMAHPKPVSEEEALVNLLRGLDGYVLAYKGRFESNLSNDAVLGPAWLDMAKGLIDLLNGPAGRLDCGTVDSMVRAMSSEAGFKEGDL